MEVLKNLAQKDLKDFNVWKMGSFHIIMTFLDITGRSFKDAGLKHLLIESILFGMQSFFIQYFYGTLIIQTLYSLLSIRGTSTGPKKMVLLTECSTYPNCSISGTSMKPKKKSHLSNFSLI